MPAGDMPAGARGQAFQYPAGELITSSLSNKGNATAFGQDNTFRVLEQNAIRIIDDKGNLLFSGTGPEAARQAVEIGKNLSDTLGNKAGWTIQTGERTINPDGSVGGMRYYDVANEKVNKSALDKIAGVVGTALPIAVGFIPGLQGVGAVLASAGAGGVGAALKGQDILKGTIMGGLSAAGGQVIGDAITGATNIGANAARAIGTGVGSTVGGVATGQSLSDALLGGVASGGLSYLGGEIMRPGARTTTGGDTSASVPGGNLDIDPSAITVTGTRLANLAAPSVNLSAAPKPAEPKEQTSELTPEEIIVTAGRTPDLTSSVFSVPGLAPLPQEVSDFAVKPAEELPLIEETPPAAEPAPVDDEIVVTADTGPALGSSTFSVPGLTPLPQEITDFAVKPAEELPLAEETPPAEEPVPVDDEIVVTADTSPALGSSTFSVPGLAPLPQEITDFAAKPAEELPPAEEPIDDEIIVTADTGPALGSSTFSVPGLAPLPQEITDFAAKPAEELPPAEEPVDDEIIVTADNTPALTSSTFSVPGLTPLPQDILDLAAKPTEELPPAEEPAPTDDEIFVDAKPTATTGSSTFAVGTPNINTDFSVPKDITDLAEQTTEEPTDDEIFVDAKPTATTGSSTLTVGAPKVEPDFKVPDEIIVKAQEAADTGSSTVAVDTKFPDEIIVEAKKEGEPTPYVVTPPATITPKHVDPEGPPPGDTKKDDGFGVKELLALLGLLGAAGGGGGGTGAGTGTGGKFQDIFTKKLPTPGEGGALKVSGLKGPTKGPAGTYSARPVTDWYRFGMGPAMDIPAGADLSGATSPYAGFGPGTLGQETFKAVSGIPEQPTGMYAGGSMGYSRGSSRESFAVNGPGTGRSDDIPAVLSDGEYVIDAETVALLGDGSSKAGAKRLDELRVNIRKHKGRNLAKGKFSVNAKRPEKYLSGGRA